MIPSRTHFWESNALFIQWSQPIFIQLSLHSPMQFHSTFYTILTTIPNVSSIRTGYLVYIFHNFSHGRYCDGCTSCVWHDLITPNAHHCTQVTQLSLPEIKTIISQFSLSIFKSKRYTWKIVSKTNLLANMRHFFSRIFPFSTFSSLFSSEQIDNKHWNCNWNWNWNWLATLGRHVFRSICIVSHSFCSFAGIC